MPSPNIYFKLGVGITSWQHQRFNIRLTEGGIFTSYMPMNNTDTQLMEALNAGTIVQITEFEYNQIIQDNGSPNVIDPNQMLAADFGVGCPVPLSILFYHVAGVWYKLYWKDLRDCVASEPGLIYNIKFKVGKPGFAQDGDSSFGSIGFVDRTMVMAVNGVRMYSAAEWTDGDVTDVTGVDTVDFDIATGIFTRPYKFKKGELIEVWDQRATSTIPPSFP